MNKIKKLSDYKKQNLSGGVMGLSGNLLCLGIMVLPTLIQTVMQVGETIYNAIKGPEQNSQSQDSSRDNNFAFNSVPGPRPFFKLSPVVSRSTVGYGMPWY